ncbi:MAG: hypothetical protein AAFS07_04425 [Pseudomonadota bacterium]
MIGAVVILGVLYALYVIADRWLRIDTQRKLEERHASGEAGGVNREDYVQKGLAEYERSTEKKLLLGLFAVPIVVVIILAMLAK